ncbi:MAG: UvrD-helicase domain-containing protein [Clostridia bacterium]|nr:UvrD-helicase domain-containing protein [Clostridia bacterium]
MTDNRTKFLQLRRKIIEKEFSRMNNKQLEAVLTINGPLLILAGAGSGKTTVLVNRIANLIRFGDAYVTDAINFDVEDGDIVFLEQYLNGEHDQKDSVDAMLAHKAAQPWQILAITFTNKAAGELKNRLELMLPKGANEIWASTFHSCCARILRQHSDKLGYTRNFTIYDTDDQKKAIKQALERLNIDEKFLPVKYIMSEISHSKDQMVSPEEYAEQYQFDFRKKSVGMVYSEYQQILKESDAMDFDDLIVKTVELLQNNPDVLGYYQHRFRYVLVDEYQDTNHVQYLLTSMLAGGYNNLCVVGDDDQSIYRFRGATIENILSFEKQYTNAKVIRLEQNYRSTGIILDAANAVIKNNENRKGKNLWTDAGAGEKITMYCSSDETREGEYIADTIVDNVNGGMKWSDHAILYRMNAQSNMIERAFIRMGVPYRILGGRKFYDRKEIKDALAYLQVINNTSDSVRLRRIINEPKRGIGDTTVNNAAEIAQTLGMSLFEVIKTADEYAKLSKSSKGLLKFAKMIEDLQELAQTATLKELFDEVMEQSGYINALSGDPETCDERRDNLRELSSNLLKYSEENPDGDLPGFLEEVALMTDIDNYDETSDSVVMMTLHASKGLEFPVVFIPGMEEGIFPSMQTMYDNSEVEEERRLAYVGITRAKKKLYLTNTQKRMLFGKTSLNRQSRFALEIPHDCVERKSDRFSSSSSFSPIGAGKNTTQKSSYLGSNSFGKSSFAKPAASAPTESFSIGDRVKHKVFGEGTVLSCQKMGNDTLLEIAFDTVGTKKVMAKFAKLSK